MSGRKQFKEQADEGMMRAFYDVEADMSLGAGIELDVRLVRTKRKGIYEIVLTATGSPKIWKSSGRVVYRREWPRSEVATLAGAMFQAITALDVMLGQEIASDAWIAMESPWET